MIFITLTIARKVVMWVLLLCTALFSVLTLSLLDFGSLTLGQEQFLTYKDTKGMFTIQYPDSWEKKENQSGGVSFYIPETPAVFSIYVQSLEKLEDLYNTEVSSLEQFVDRNVQYLQGSYFGNRLIPDGLTPTTISNQSAFRAESEPGTGSSPASRDKMLHLWALVGDSAYTFTFRAREPVYLEYLPTIDRMIETFKSMKKSATQPPIQQQQPQQNQQLAQSYSPPPGQQESIPLPEFVPKPGENIEPISDQFSMTVKFQPYPYGFGWYQVSDWQLALSNPNRWCPSQNCTFQLSLGYLGPGESTRGGGHFFGLLKTNSDDTTRTSNLEADWTAVEELIQGGQTVQVIEGTLTLSTYVASLRTDNQYRISGTLTPHGEDVLQYRASILGITDLSFAFYLSLQ